MSHPAGFIVHWPGKDVPACAEHAAALTSLALSMGFFVSATATDTEELECTNCKNEACEVRRAIYPPG